MFAIHQSSCALSALEVIGRLCSVSQMSNAMSQLIGLKEKGLPRIARLLQSNSSDVVRSGASLLSNMSRHPVLHKTMGK